MLKFLNRVFVNMALTGLAAMLGSALTLIILFMATGLSGFGPAVQGEFAKDFIIFVGWVYLGSVLLLTALDYIFDPR